MSKSIQYDKNFIDNLLERTEYELWFLEAAYDLAGRPLFPSWPDQLIYSPGENKPSMINYGSCNIIIGDWRPVFLAAGSPLIFVTAFKLLDMFVDLVLEKNGFGESFRFIQKIATLKTGVVFPDFIEYRPWLSKRIVGLYETLVPLRGTIIHKRHFSTTDGNLKVSSFKKGIIVQEYIIEREQLRSLAVLIVSVIRYVEGSWKIDTYKEKILRRAFDDLQNFHGQPSMGQQLPRFLTARMYVVDSERIAVDLRVIRKDIERWCLNQDVVFDIRIITASIEKNALDAYLIPWSEIEHEGDELVFMRTQLAKFLTNIPDDIKPEKIFKEIKKRA